MGARLLIQRFEEDRFVGSNCCIQRSRNISEVLGNWEMFVGRPRQRSVQQLVRFVVGTAVMATPSTPRTVSGVDPLTPAGHRGHECEGPLLGIPIFPVWTCTHQSTWNLTGGSWKSIFFSKGPPTSGSSITPIMLSLARRGSASFQCTV